MLDRADPASPSSRSNGDDAIGSLRCKDAQSATGSTCTPGTLGRELTYPATSTAVAGHPAHRFPTRR